MTSRGIVLVTAYGTAVIQAIRQKMDPTAMKKWGFLQARGKFYDAVHEEGTTSQKGAIENLLAVLDEAAGLD